MFRLRSRLRNPIRVLLILAACIVVAGIIIDRNTGEFTLQTAVGQTNDTLQTSEDFLHLERANRAFIDLVARTRPAVVQITTRTQRTLTQQPGSPFRNDFYRFFFGPESESIPDTQPQPARGLGSGVIVREDGYILTNNHVVEDVDDITVILANGREYDAELVGSDPAERNGGGTDLALIKIDEKDLPTLQFGDSDALEVGEWVIAIGSPLGFSQSVTRGIVSAKGRDEFSRRIRYSDFIQTDAPVNQGNSGGALINIRGELVGINTLIATGGFSTGNIGLGFAIPSNMIQQLMPDLIEKGKVVRGWLGIYMSEVGHDLADRLEFASPQGVVVRRVIEDSPAEKAGIQARDIILDFDGEPVRGLQHLMHTVAATKVGKPVKLTVLRGGSEEKQLTVKLVERTAEVVDRSEQRVFRGGQRESFAGIRVRNLTAAVSERYGYASDETGVIVTEVESGSDAEKKGIGPGYLIQEMEWRPVGDLDAYYQLVEKLKAENKEKVLLYVKSPDGRGGGYVTIKVSSSDR